MSPDHHGHYVLQSIRGARRFNRWVLSRFQEYVGERVLDAGCGIGNFTELLLDRSRLICVDANPSYVEELGRQFGDLAHVSVREMDLTRREHYAILRDEAIDTVICLNVMEHVEADETVLRQYWETLVPGGYAVIVVPAHRFLFSACDEALGHVRRYSREELGGKMRSAGFEMVELRAFNRLGVLGWMLNKWLGRRAVSPRQMRWYESLLPLAKCMDFLRLGPGLSLMAVGRKPVDSERLHDGFAVERALAGASRGA